MTWGNRIQLFMEKKVVDLEEEAFSLRLSKAPAPVVNEYYRLKLDEQIHLAEENDGHPVAIPIERRKELLGQANINIGSGIHIDLKHMRESLGSRDTPLTGGAKDD